MKRLEEELEGKFLMLSTDDKLEVLEFINHIQNVHALTGMSRQEKAIIEIQQGLKKEISF